MSLLLLYTVLDEVHTAVEVIGYCAPSNTTINTAQKLDKIIPMQVTAHATEEIKARETRVKLDVDNIVQNAIFVRGLNQLPFKLYIYNPEMDKPSSELATTGSYQAEVCEYLSIAATHLLGHKDKVTFLEINANVGYVSLFLVSSNKNIKSILVEQNSIYVDLLRDTLDDPFNKALAERIQIHHLVIQNDNNALKVACLKTNRNDGRVQLDAVSGGVDSLDWNDLPCSYVPVKGIDDITKGKSIDFFKFSIEDKTDYTVLYSRLYFAFHIESPKIIVIDYVLEGKGSMATFMGKLYEFGYEKVTDLKSGKVMTKKLAISTYFEQEHFVNPSLKHQTVLVLQHRSM